MDMQTYRSQMDEVDQQLVSLFVKRMELSQTIAQYKADHKLPLYDPQREREKLSHIASQVGPSMATYTDALYSFLFEMSRSCQRKQMGQNTALTGEILKALEQTEPLFPPRALVACQGVEGAFSQQACEKIFSSPHILYFNSFEGVFSAIDKGLCRYGILPLENSSAGSVNKIYDLMIKYNFSIVRSTRLKVDHCLLVNPGVKLKDIKEILSHDQAFAQCQDFLKTMENVKISSCDNTAAAAKYLYESGRADAAALSSRNCAELYGLDCLQESVQDQGSNYTRFICISKKLEIFPGADITSIMMVLPHKPGSVYKVLARFYALGINLIKLESRPLPNSDFEFMFYFDLDVSVYSDAFKQIFGDLEELCVSMKYLGSYTEAV